MQNYLHYSELEGIISAPGSKSYMQRALLAGLLAGGETILRSPSICDDTIACRQACEALGLKIIEEHDLWRLKRDRFHRAEELHCGESGLCLRMMSPVAALFDWPILLTGKGTLKTRPMSMLVEPLTKLGANCSLNDQFLPIHIRGPLQGGNITIDGSSSSQFLTGLLMALPLIEHDSHIQALNLKSTPYIDMTLNILNKFSIWLKHLQYKDFFISGRQQYCAADITIEGDWSGAAFLLVAGAIAGKITITGLNPHSLQADRAIITALQLARGNFAYNDQNQLIIEPSTLKGFEFDASDCPDLFPPLTVLALHCQGISRIYGTNRLKYKESDRAFALVYEFSRLGGQIIQKDNYIEIEGNRPLAGEINSHHDHRIAMAGAIAGLRSKKGIRILNSEAVSKSYPKFFEDLKKLNATLFWEEE